MAVKKTLYDEDLQKKDAYILELENKKGELAGLVGQNEQLSNDLERKKTDLDSKDRYISRKDEELKNLNSILSKAKEGKEASGKKAEELQKSFEKLKTTSAATLEAKEKQLTNVANQKSLAVGQIAQLMNAALPLVVGNSEVWKVVATDLMTRRDVNFTLKDCQRTWIFYPPLTNETRYIEELIQNQTTTILAF